MQRRYRETPEERAENQAIKDSMEKVNLDSVLRNLSGETGDDSSSGEFSMGKSGSITSNESGGLSIGLGGSGKDDVLDALVSVAASGLGNNLEIPPATESLGSTAINTKTAQKKNANQGSSRYAISQNQYKALQRFPALIEFLGQSGGEKIAHRISCEINNILASRIEENSKEAHEYALTCESDNQNLKQYFRGGDWVCRVTASGPFRGDEAIYYSKEHDSSFVLRKQGDGYADVTRAFNIIHEAKEVEPAIDDLEIIDEN